MFYQQRHCVISAAQIATNKKLFHLLTSFHSNETGTLISFATPGQQDIQNDLGRREFGPPKLMPSVKYN